MTALKVETVSLLQINNISISFGGLKAVDNVSLRVDQGEIVSLIGPNGAGKTTVFNILTGVYKIETGEIIFEENIIHNKTPQEIVKFGIARTFQNIRLFRKMRVIENVMIGSHITEDYNFFQAVFRTRKFRNVEMENMLKAIRLLRDVGLIDRLHDYAVNLSYGEQRKLEIARAIATGAKLLLLDEPAAGMNHQETDELLRFIQQLRDRGYTILLIEHDMNVVMNISDRVYVLDYGKLIADGEPREITNNPKVIEAYLGAVPNAAN